MNKRDFVLNKLTMIGITLYIFLLLLERIISLFLSISLGEYPLKTGNWFSIITFIIVIISIISSIYILFKPTISILEHIFRKKDDYVISFRLNQIITGCMALLYSGMVHTSYNITPLQFIAYGFLIMAMIVRTIKACYQGKNHFHCIISVIYLTCFSMAIPVVYYAIKYYPYNCLFYIFEFLAILVLIPIFKNMLIIFFDTGLHNFKLKPLLTMLIFAIFIISLGWSNQLNSPNVFLLSAAISTAIAYLVFVIKRFIDSK